MGHRHTETIQRISNFENIHWHVTDQTVKCDFDDSVCLTPLQGFTLSLNIFWFLPTSGDTRYLGKSDFGRPPSIGYLNQVAVATDNLGYDGLLIPTGSGCHDPFAVASSVVAVTKRLKLLVTLSTSLGSLVAAASQRVIDMRCRLAYLHDFFDTALRNKQFMEFPERQHLRLVRLQPGSRWAQRSL